jgi:hypothetical protein
MMGAVRQRALDRGCVKQAVAVVERTQLHRRIASRGGGLVSVHVRALGTEHLGPHAGEHTERELVRHRARRHVEGGGGAGRVRGELLQPVDGRVLAVAVVAHLGGGHREPHRFGRRRDGVGSKIDEP